MLTAVINARIFDGERVLEERTVLLEDANVRALGETSAAADQVVDARGGTLIPASSMPTFTPRTTGCATRSSSASRLNSR